VNPEKLLNKLLEVIADYQCNKLQDLFPGPLEVCTWSGVYDKIPPHPIKAKPEVVKISTSLGLKTASSFQRNIDIRFGKIIY
jgi:hypothetical protein